MSGASKSPTPCPSANPPPPEPRVSSIYLLRTGDVIQVLTMLMRGPRHREGNGIAGEEPKVFPQTMWQKPSRDGPRNLEMKWSGGRGSWKGWQNSGPCDGLEHCHCVGYTQHGPRRLETLLVPYVPSLGTPAASILTSLFSSRHMGITPHMDGHAYALEAGTKGTHTNVRIFREPSTH